MCVWSFFVCLRRRTRKSLLSQFIFPSRFSTFILYICICMYIVDMMMNENYVYTHTQSNSNQSEKRIIIIYSRRAFFLWFQSLKCFTHKRERESVDIQIDILYNIDIIYKPISVNNIHHRASSEYVHFCFVWQIPTALICQTLSFMPNVQYIYLLYYLGDAYICFILSV